MSGGILQNHGVLLITSYLYCSYYLVVTIYKGNGGRSSSCQYVVVTPVFYAITSSIFDVIIFHQVAANTNVDDDVDDDNDDVDDNSSCAFGFQFSVKPHFLCEVLLPWQPSLFSVLLWRCPVGMASCPACYFNHLPAS